MNLDKFPTYIEEPPPEGYVSLTYAWDLLNSEKAMMLREAERLQEKGEDIVIVIWDTRKAITGTDVRVGENQVSSKPSLWGELWAKR
jgi:hypothetical protein